MVKSVCVKLSYTGFDRIDIQRALCLGIALNNKRTIWGPACQKQVWRAWTRNYIRSICRMQLLMLAFDTCPDTQTHMRMGRCMYIYHIDYICKWACNCLPQKQLRITTACLITGNSEDCNTAPSRFQQRWPAWPTLSGANHWWPVDSPYKGPIIQKACPHQDHVTIKLPSVLYITM